MAEVAEDHVVDLNNYKNIQKMNQKIFSIIFVVVVVVFGGVLLNKQKEKSFMKSNTSQQALVNTDSSMTQPSDIERQPFSGDKGETVDIIEGTVSLDKSKFETNKVKFFNVALEDGKTVYFLVLKDDLGNFRVAANANEKCAPYGKGYKQEGDKLTCITCGKSYPIKDFAIEQPDCNPKPLTTKANTDDKNIKVLSSDLQKLAYLFN